jgi:predicted nucleic acid-binding protein
MIFTDLTGGESIFLDANTFVYHFTQHPIFGVACTDLLNRIERQEILAYTSTHILTEIAHRVMTVEASAAFNWPYAGIAARLRRHPAQVQALAGFQRAVETIVQSRVQILLIPTPVSLSGTAVSRQTGLLSNDALIVAVMQANGLSNLASHDADFDRVPGLTHYSPA